MQIQSSAMEFAKRLRYSRTLQTRKSHLERSAAGWNLFIPNFARFESLFHIYNFPKNGDIKREKSSRKIRYAHGAASASIYIRARHTYSINTRQRRRTFRSHSVQRNLFLHSLEHK